MSLGRDDNDDRRRRLDDATAEALIAGETAAGADDLARVSAFLQEVRALGEGPPPPPSPALARMLAGEPEPRPAGFLRLVGGDEGTAANPPAASNGHRRRAGARVAGQHVARPSGVVGRAAVLALVATAGVTGAAAARLLPEPAQSAVSRAIETVTPFEVPGARGGDADDNRGDGVDGAGEALSRQGEPFDPRDGDRAAVPAGDPAERRQDQSVDQPAAPEGTGERATPDPTVSGDRPEQPADPRPGPALGGGATTDSPAPGSPPAPPRAPASAQRDRAESAPAPPAGGRTYTATLTGNTDPAQPGDPGGSGRASVTLHLGRELLCLAVTTSEIDPVASVHLHEASAPSTEPIVTGPAPAGDGSPACFDVGREVLRKVRTDPAGHYVEVHNAEFPDGALRGSLER